MVEYFDDWVDNPPPHGHPPLMLSHVTKRVAIQEPEIPRRQLFDGFNSEADQAF